jgi:hypothetical protein
MVITVTIKSYEQGHRFNVTMKSVEDNVLALKVAIKNYNSLALELENIILVSEPNLKPNLDIKLNPGPRLNKFKHFGKTQKFQNFCQNEIKQNEVTREFDIFPKTLI